MPASNSRVGSALSAWEVCALLAYHLLTLRPAGILMVYP
jgi:hypothetical protein